MERQLWKKIVTLMKGINKRGNGVVCAYTDAVIVKVWFWAVLHDRPISWACKNSNWPSENGCLSGTLTGIAMQPDSNTFKKINNTGLINAFKVLVAPPLRHPIILTAGVLRGSVITGSRVMIYQRVTHSFTLHKQLLTTYVASFSNS